MECNADRIHANDHCSHEEMSIIFLIWTYSYVYSEAWCKVMDSKKKEVLPILERAYGEGQGLKWYVNWRLFFM